MEVNQLQNCIRHFKQINLHLDQSEGILWLAMNPAGRPCFTVELVREIIAAHELIMKHDGIMLNGDKPVRVRYQVMTSTPDKPYNLGGDLELFIQCLRDRDRRRLTDYARLCIDGLYPTACNFGGNITTIALVRGQALGGGFESALASSILVAESDARFGLPEVMFNLFPGMGAYQLLSRRVSPAQAERMILSGKLYKADELLEMGIVDIVSDPGEGEKAIYDYVRRHRHHRNTHVAVQKIRQIYQQVSYKDLMRICHLWVDTAMQLTDRDIRIMERLVKAQYRVSVNDMPAEQDFRAIA
jgi:DSF synthase